MSVKYAFRPGKSKAHALTHSKAADCKLHVAYAAAIISGQSTLLPHNKNVNNRKVQSENKEMKNCNPDVCMYVGEFVACKYL